MIFNGRNIHIGANVTIGNNVRIGDNTTIYDNVSIGDDSVICSNCTIGEPLFSYFNNMQYENPSLHIGKKALIRNNSIIYAGSTIGDNFQSGHFSTIRENNTIGDNCMVGPYCVILNGCTIGNFCRFHSYDEIGEKTIIKDFVFFYPKVLVSTDPTPPSNTELSSSFGEFTQVASNVMVMPGTTVGRHCLITAQARISGRIKDFMVICGSPGKRLGDIRELPLIDPLTKTTHYPWPFHFSRNMPWEKQGFEAWAQANNYDISDLYERENE